MEVGVGEGSAKSSCCMEIEEVLGERESRWITRWFDSTYFIVSFMISLVYC